ncbi:MAG: T9SS type A sorting domain-containing protein [Saprospiraceae bacterium]
MPDVENGAYTIRYFSCLTGALLSTETVAAAGGSLVLALPDLVWDVAFVAERGAVGTTEITQNLPLKIYPNPASAGPLTVAFDLEQPENVSLVLFDMAGRELGGLFSGQLPGGPQSLSVNLPDGLPGGVYRLKTVAGNRVGAVALAINF